MDSEGSNNLTAEGSKPLTFAEYIREIGGSGIIYTQEFEDILKDWKKNDWVYADEYVAPIVHTVLVDAADVHPILYSKLMEMIISAYYELKEGLGPQPDLPHLRRIK